MVGIKAGLTAIVLWTLLASSVGLDSSVGTAISYGLDVPGIESLSRPALGLTQPPI